MKDLFEFIAGRAIGYMRVLFRIVAHPRRNILTLARRDHPLGEAVIFFLVTTAIGLALQAPFIMEQRDLVTFASVTAVYRVVELAATALALTLVFRLLRGAGSYESVLAATFYIISPLYLAVVLVLMFMNGVLTGFAPELAQEWRISGELSVGSSEAIAQTNLGAAAALFLASVLVPLVVVIWLIAVWPVYARLNEFGRWRAIASFALGLLVVWIVGEVSIVIMNGLYPGGLGGVV